MAKIKFGPSGIGPVKDTLENLKRYKAEGLDAAEFTFTYGVYLKKGAAVELGDKIKELGMSLSIHAPYYINLNSKEKEKIAASKKRILDCCEVGHLVGARKIVFHPGYYSKTMALEKKSELSGGEKRIIEESYLNIKDAVLDLMKEIKKNKWDVELCPEVMGKVNVFGSIEEISRLTKDTGCSFCIDFAHILARYKDYSFDLVKKSFPQKDWQCHFSGIEYGEKGEKNHILTDKKEWKTLFDFLKTLDKNVSIINESPNPEGDAVKGLGIWGG